MPNGIECRWRRSAALTVPNELDKAEHMPLDPDEAATVNELRKLYRDAESRAARLRFIVDVHALTDRSSFADAAQTILARIAAFAGAPASMLTIEASHGEPAFESAFGSGEVFGDEVTFLADEGGVIIRLALRVASGRDLTAADREALEVVMRHIAGTVGVERQGAERLRLLEEVAAKRAELTALVARLIEAQEQERLRVAHDLHDGSAQTMAALAHRLEMTLSDVPDADGITHELQALAAIARRSVAEIRAAIADLRPPELDDLGLPVALEARLDALDAFAVAADLSPAAETWPPAVCLVLYRVAQEALTNVVKHAGASRVSMRLFEEDHTAHLHVCDDGTGFEARASAGSERLGIAGMRERLALIGGELHIERAEPRGTIIRAVVPLDARPRSR
jgi:signal transduction histidine kinase